MKNILFPYLLSCSLNFSSSSLRQLLSGWSKERRWDG